MTKSFNIAEAFPYTSGFNITDTATNELLIEVSDAEASDINALCIADELAPGSHPKMDAFADLMVDVVTGAGPDSITIDVFDADTALAVWQRVGPTLGRAMALGAISPEVADQAVLWVATSEGMPMVGSAKMDSMAVDMFELAYMAHVSSLLGGDDDDDLPAQNAPATATIQ